MPKARYRILEMSNGNFKVQSKYIFSFIFWFDHSTFYASYREAKSFIDWSIDYHINKVIEKKLTVINITEVI